MKTRRPTERRGSQTAARPRRRHGLEPRMELPGSDGFAPTERDHAELDHAAANQAAEEILGANPLVGFDRSEIFDALGRFAKLLALDPGIVVREQINLAREFFNVITGRSQQQPDPKDRRFSHEIWQKN